MGTGPESAWRRGPRRQLRHALARRTRTRHSLRGSALRAVVPRSPPAAVSQCLRPAPPGARRIVAGGRGLGDSGSRKRGSGGLRGSDGAGRQCLQPPEAARGHPGSGGECGLAGWARGPTPRALARPSRLRSPALSARRLLTPGPRPGAKEVQPRGHGWGPWRLERAAPAHGGGRVGALGCRGGPESPRCGRSRQVGGGAGREHLPQLPPVAAAWPGAASAWRSQTP